MFWLNIIVIICLIILAVGLAVYQMYRRQGRYLPKPTYREPHHKFDVLSWDDESLYIAWIGHSTMLMSFRGLMVMTDPVFSERVGLRTPFFTVGPKRHVAPAMSIDDCPPIDVVMLSHAHMDHVDFPSLKRVVRAHTTILTPHGTGHILRRLGAKHVVEVAAGEKVELDNGLIIVGQQVRHWGSRFPWNKSYGYLGYIVMQDSYRVFFAGDTAYTGAFEEVAKYDVQVSCMPIGAYMPEHYQSAHCTPEQAFEMFLDTGATYLIPMHHDTFVLSHEPVDEPMQRLLKYAGKKQDAIVLQHHGQTFRLKI